MTALATCPGCGARFDASAVACPICLRHRTRQEIFQGLGSRAAKPSKLPLAAVRGVLWVFIGAAILYYGLRNAPPGGWARLLPEGAAPRGPIPAPPSAGKPSAPPTPSPGGGAPGLTGAGAVTAPAAPAAPAAPTSWRVHGGVYDLGDLSPVAGVKLVFTDRSNGESREKRTDAKGLYSIELPLASDWGFDLKVRHALYDGVYLEDSEPSFRAQSAEARRDAIGLTETSKIVHVPLAPPDMGDSLEHNIFLRPSRRPRR